MGKLEKLGRSILKKLGAGTNRRRRAGDVINATSSSSSSSSSSDDDSVTLTPPASRSAAAEAGFIHQFQVVPPDDVPVSPESPEVEEVVRSQSSAASDEGSAGYATDDTALSSLSPLDVKRTSVDYSESQGYYSTAELSPREDPKTPPIPRIVLEEEEAPAPMAPRVPLYKKVCQEYPRINVRHHQLKKDEPMFKSSQALAQETLEVPKITGRSATLSDLASEPEDPIERFLRSSIYKTKMITTVFEAKDGGFEEICSDVMHEIDRWFETKNMMAVACEMHWSVPREKRSRQMECRLKDKLLNALRENNKRLLYLRGMGKGKTPIKLAESKTVENIARDRETDSVRGIYQRSYTRLLPYLHKETPEWHSQYWTLQDIQQEEPRGTAVQPSPQQFLFNSEPADVLSKNSLISLNIIGLSILGNSRKSSDSLFFG